MNLSGKTVLITGASGGIGKAIAASLSKEGCRLILCCNKNPEALTAAGAAYVFQGDLSSEAEVTRLFDELSGRGLLPEMLVNNAGISKVGLFTDMSADELDEIFSVNVKAAMLVTKAALKSMIRSHCGSIVNISSMWGEVGASCEVAYSATKGALIAFTKALAKEVGLSGIRVNCITPGVIDTPMNAHLSEEDVDNLKDETPLGRIGRSEDVADAVSFLLSDRASYITGQILGVNGGFVI